MMYEGVEVFDRGHLEAVASGSEGYWDLHNALLWDSCLPYRQDQNKFHEGPAKFSPRLLQWFQGLNRLKEEE